MMVQGGTDSMRTWRNNPDPSGPHLAPDGRVQRGDGAWPFTEQESTWAAIWCRAKASFRYHNWDKKEVKKMKKLAKKDKKHHKKDKKEKKRKKSRKHSTGAVVLGGVAAGALAVGGVALAAGDWSGSDWSGGSWSDFSWDD